jgi:hypothetical protein
MNSGGLGAKDSGIHSTRVAGLKAKYLKPSKGMTIIYGAGLFLICLDSLLKFLGGNTNLRAWPKQEKTPSMNLSVSEGVLPTWSVVRQKTKSVKKS